MIRFIQGAVVLNGLGCMPLSMVVVPTLGLFTYRMVQHLLSLVAARN